MAEIQSLLRKNIRLLVPYSSARDEYKGGDAVFLDANENPYNHPLNRYPDPLQVELKNRIAKLKQIPAENLFLGNGSDEAIDLLIRAFCDPAGDNIIAIKPTYGMYKVCADINQVEYREALLSTDYQPDIQKLISLADSRSKLMFLCSPNNPTSNNLNRESLISLVRNFNGLVVVDEAYVDFSTAGSLSGELSAYSNLVLLQTFSKAWGMAGIRLGMAIGHREIIAIMNRIKYPYNINVLTQRTALEQLNEARKDIWVNMILEQRARLTNRLREFPMVEQILPSDANFLMVKFNAAREVFNFLIASKIIVRDRSKVPLCEGFLRITVGTPEENHLLIETLNEYAEMKKQ
jgi:histidinol-phosphate aminotransferase